MSVETGLVMNNRTTCVIAGGGPAGMICGLILARAGVEVTVLEKHGDFLRDFRGDTVHPSTLRLLDELGLGVRFDELPYSRIDQLRLPVEGGGDVVAVDFNRLRLTRRYVAMTPQWDLLNVLAEAGAAEPSFTLRMNTEVTGLLRERGRVAGVQYLDPEGAGELHADLVIACDGRWSICRQEALLPLTRYPVNLDVWWFRLETHAPIGASLLPRGTSGGLFILIPRRGYVQVARLIPKGADAAYRARGIEALREQTRAAIPEADVGAMTLDDVKLLDVEVNRLSRWWAPGLLCIGDAAHAMSPVGGVGINLAVQDGVAAAAELAEPLRTGTLTDKHLAAVQRRRITPAALTQAVQLQAHSALESILAQDVRLELPHPLATLLRREPMLAGVPARLVGVGVLPEHAPRFARRPQAAAGRARP